MRTLEELKLTDDGGSFDRLVKKVEEAVDGDESLKQKLLTEVVLRGFIQKAAKLLAVKEKQSNFGVEFVNLSFRIPKKIRIKVPPPHVSRVESNDKSVMGRCYFGVVEEAPAVTKQRKADSLDKKRKAADSCLGEKPKKKKGNIIKKHNLDGQLGFNPPPELPQEFKDQIQRLNGTDVTLVIQKELTWTDMDSSQARFSMPRQQVITHGFLSEEETHILSQKGIQCSLIQPCLETIDFEFKRWKMGKTFSYTLIKNWNSVAYNTRNYLEIGSKVQLWSFRIGSRLWFALVNLKETFGNGDVTSI